MQKRKAVILGSSGLIGSFCLQELLKNEHYSEIYALVRHPGLARHPRLSEILVDFDRPESWAHDFAADDVFCCIGTTLKKTPDKEAYRKIDFGIPAQAAEFASLSGAKQFLVVSALGANSKSSNFYLRLKGEMEEAVEKKPLEGIHIFRPSFLLGRQTEFRLGEKITEFLTPLLRLLMQGPLKPFTPVKGETVAKAMVNAALAGRHGKFVYTYREIKELAGL